MIGALLLWLALGYGFYRAVPYFKNKTNLRIADAEPSKQTRRLKFVLCLLQIAFGIYLRANAIVVIYFLLTLIHPAHQWMMLGLLVNIAASAIALLFLVGLLIDGLIYLRSETKLSFAMRLSAIVITALAAFVSALPALGTLVAVAAG